MDAVVFGNVALDVICQGVEDVPRHESIGFERAAISPGGCASNVAIGLRALGVSTTIVAIVGLDEAGRLLQEFWERHGLDLRFLRRTPAVNTGVSVGLVDREAQPRFIHTPGASALLTVDDLDLPGIAAEGARCLHVAGFFVLPGLLDGRLPEALRQARLLGLQTSLDVVRSPRMKDPTPLWPCLPYLDIFLCNQFEAWRLTGEDDPGRAAQALCKLGAGLAIIKLGAEGCWVESENLSLRVAASRAPVVDTTGAGDAFAAGLLAALMNGADLRTACQAGNSAGARMVGVLGSIAGWFQEPGQERQAGK